MPRALRAAAIRVLPEPSFPAIEPDESSTITNPPPSRADVLAGVTAVA
ncbi:hypothetical protein AB0952_00885 [Streptomyces caniferus]